MPWEPLGNGTLSISLCQKLNVTLAFEIKMLLCQSTDLDVVPFILVTKEHMLNSWVMIDTH